MPSRDDRRKAGQAVGDVTPRDAFGVVDRRQVDRPIPRQQEADLADDRRARRRVDGDAGPSQRLERLVEGTLEGAREDGGFGDARRERVSLAFQASVPRSGSSVHHESRPRRRRSLRSLGVGLSQGGWLPAGFPRAPRALRSPKPNRCGCRTLRAARDLVNGVIHAYRPNRSQVGG